MPWLKRADKDHYAYHRPEDGSRFDVFKQDSITGPLWRFFVTDPQRKQTELLALSGTEPVRQDIIDKLLRQQGGEWIPVDVEQEKTLKRERGPDFEDFWHSGLIKDEIKNLLSQGRDGAKDYEFEPGRYEYGLSFEGGDTDGLAKFFGIEIPEDPDQKEWLHETVEEFGQDLLSGLPGKWGLPGDLIFGPFAESGEYALSYLWEDDDIEAFEEGQKGKEAPSTPEEVQGFDPQEEIDKALEEYYQTDDEDRKRELEERIKRMRQRQ